MANDKNETETLKSVKEEYITEVIEKEFGKNAKVKKIEEVLTSGAGENYASDLHRIQVDVELEDKTETTVSYIYKAMPNSEFGGQMLKAMNIFPREIEIYTKIIPKFEELYKEAGKTVRFSPKCVFVAPGEEAFLMEDLKPKKFVNAKRQIGLNIDQVKRTLEKLAEYHAASVIVYERDGYAATYIEGIFKEEIMKPMLEMQKSLMNIYIDCLKQNENVQPYIHKMLKMLDYGFDKFLDAMKVNENEFNVLNHGDLWCNNIMFQYDDNDNITETYFVDYAAAKYGSPSQDLWYFLLSSCEKSIKIDKFEYFVKFYHDKLIENLKLLQYTKELPKLLDLQIQLLKNSLWAFSTVQGLLPIILVDPTELATMDNFMDTGDAGMKFKIMSFSNPRYLDALEELLPWLDNKGIMD
ncbi:uncharacterized protein LOC129605237 [Condylostylus longicornis]|uniref:uncharacterized protein LOC129605237 n=1 Tax=Condylostylus longicornis TaxID=2530218 RepID=UPI00244E1E9F|nr:uncharacterized protein LOC129605237 [Condylostylus longicornis]XP_055370840.1 uncharacterized protein LOC129605237 [Condylostylus longicornis]